MVAATRWRAPPLDDLLIEPLDQIVAIFHRASGITVPHGTRQYRTGAPEPPPPPSPP